jgi:putative Mg2+ transporter-C (MgtC) family protein
VELNAPVPLHLLEPDVISRLVVAAAIGLLLGLDRELRGHAAGLRTHGLICFGSATMAVSYIALYFQLEGERMDPLRMFEAAGAFVGIIGAGLIVFAKGEVKNVTTAAHLFLTAIAGIACGAGQWPLVAIAAIISLLLLTLIGIVESKLFPKTEHNGS